MISARRKTAVSTNEAQVSVLTCLFIAGCFLVIETLVDIVGYPFGGHRTAIDLNLIALNERFLDFLKLPHLYAFGVEWWLPVVICSVFFGSLWGWRGIGYSVCGVVVFLVILHNFRGIMPRHNVFEGADDIRRFHSMGEDMNIPDPWFWDAGYFAFAILGSALGWGLRALGAPKRKAALTPPKGYAVTAVPQGYTVKQNALGPPKVSLTATLWLGMVCLILGLIESIFILSIVRYRDIYVGLPITHGYALFLFGLIVMLLVRYQKPLSEYLNFEIM